jgi:hypothetical protein
MTNYQYIRAKSRGRSFVTFDKIKELLPENTSSPSMRTEVNKDVEKIYDGVKAISFEESFVDNESMISSLGNVNLILNNKEIINLDKLRQIRLGDVKIHERVDAIIKGDTQQSSSYRRYIETDGNTKCSFISGEYPRLFCSDDEESFKSK